jgi:hypothetical protein
MGWRELFCQAIPGNSRNHRMDCQASEVLDVLKPYGQECEKRLNIDLSLFSPKNFQRISKVN